MVMLRIGALALFTLALADLHLSGGRPSVVRDEQRARAAAAAAATGEATSAPLPVARPAPLKGEAEAAGGAGTTPGVSLVSLMGRTSEHGGAEESEQTGQRLQRGDYVNQSDDMTDGGLDRNGDFHFDKPDEELKRLEDNLKTFCKLEDCHSAYLNLVIIGEELECGPKWCDPDDAPTRRGKEPCCGPDEIVCLECLRDEEEKITVLEYGFANSFCDKTTGLYTVTETAWKEYKEDPKPPGMGSLDPPYTTVTGGGTPPAPPTPGTEVVPAAAQDLSSSGDTSGSEGSGDQVEPEVLHDRDQLGDETLAIQNGANGVNGSQAATNSVADEERGEGEEPDDDPDY